MRFPENQLIQKNIQKEKKQKKIKIRVKAVRPRPVDDGPQRVVEGVAISKFHVDDDAERLPEFEVPVELRGPAIKKKKNK